MAAQDLGTAVEPSKVTVATYMRSWIETAEAVSISPKTAERYRELIEWFRSPASRYGSFAKAARGSHVANWHGVLLREGRCGAAGKAPRWPLSARTVGHAHRLLHKALGDAVRRELLFRNPSDLISPPKVAAKEMQILGADRRPGVCSKR